jgi:putative ABC transport system ATP-binding protein
MTPVLELRGVSKVYGSGEAQVRALIDIDLTVRAGEMVAIMGPSGSGKSTLLTLAGGLEQPTSGAVLIEGTELAGLSASARARMRRRQVGYVFQDFNLLPGLTAAENIALPLELDGTKAKKAAVEARRLLDELGLADKAATYPDELSGGQRQRVAIGRAMVGHRRLLLADEPSGALDTATGETVFRLLRSACKNGVAAVLATHDAQLAAWADRVVFVRDGVAIDQSGPPAGPESLLAAGSEPPR